MDWTKFFDRDAKFPINYSFEGERVLLNEEMMNQAFKNLKSYNALKSNEIRQIIAFSDQFTTCSLDINKVKEKIHRPLCDVAESENNDDYKNFIAQKVIDIVQIVNKHHHTKACRKHLTKCRFHYPKFPSTKTILAVPVSKIYDYVDVTKKSFF